MRVLWIDDEIELLNPYIYLLKERGYEVDTAANGPDGLRLVTTKGYDLIFVDQMMPGVEGLAVVEAIKGFDPSAVIVMVTKLGEEELMEEAYSKLVDDFIVKPFSPHQIISVVKRLLEKRKIITEKLTRDYLAFLREERNFNSFTEWRDYYLRLIRWRFLIERFGEESLKETLGDIQRQANDDFACFVEEIYPSWLEGKEEPPLLSHKVFGNLLAPYLREKPLYFFIFDSMRLDQWYLLVPLLKEYFNIRQFYYLSILPSATPYSRNALLSGLLPLEIHTRYPNLWVFDEMGQNRYEKELLAKLLAQEKIGGPWFYLKATKSEDIEEQRGMLLRKDVRFACIVVNFLDFLLHAARPAKPLEDILENESSFLQLTRTWFANSPFFEFIKELANQDCRVIITTDHGFIKVKRPTIIFGDMEISSNLRYKHGSALRTEGRNALLVFPERLGLPKASPDEKMAIAKSDFYFIYPTKPTQYERTYKFTYQHGGISLEEMILPLGILEKR